MIWGKAISTWITFSWMWAANAHVNIKNKQNGIWGEAIDLLGGEADDGGERGMSLRLRAGLVAVEGDVGLLDEFVVGVGVVLVFL